MRCDLPKDAIKHKAKSREKWLRVWVTRIKTHYLFSARFKGQQKNGLAFEHIRRPKVPKKMSFSYHEINLLCLMLLQGRAKKWMEINLSAFSSASFFTQSDLH